MTALDDLAPPSHSFASDNSAGVHPRVMDALEAANEGHALAYGADRYTVEAADRFRDLFGAPTETFFVWGGSGANVLALATMLGPARAVVCTDSAHINVDETGAPERVIGTKLIDVPAPDGKLRPEQIEALTHVLGVEHHAQPGVVSITQSTELGTLYSPDEVAAVTEVAHRYGMTVHMDGARIANAAAALGDDLRSFTVDAGVDVISFGGTKNGMMYGEAVVYLTPSLAEQARFVRKQVTQLPSKMRFVAVQFSALLDNGLWLQNARHANTMTARLYDQVADVGGVRIDTPPVVNSLFPRLPKDAIEPLSAWCPFYDWDVATQQVRWMTSFDTTEEDVVRFAAGVQATLADLAGARA
jgi:threonine aldolase